MRYDLIVIGNGTDAKATAHEAARMGKRVALVEQRDHRMHGNGHQKGIVPAAIMEDVVRQLMENCPRDESAGLPRRLNMEDVRRTVAKATQRELKDQQVRVGVDVYCGEAAFCSPNEVEVSELDGTANITGKKMLVAVGTRSTRPGNIPFDGERVLAADEALSLDDAPQSMVVVGGGMAGIQHAILFALMGVEVTLVDGGKKLHNALLDRARSLGVSLQMGEDVIGIDKLESERLAVHLESGKQLLAETVLMCVGSEGATENLDLAAAGLEPDERGRLWCNENHQTWQKHIYGVGEVVGFPALACTPLEQAQRVVCHAFGEEDADLLDVTPVSNSTSSNLTTSVEAGLLIGV